VSSYLSQKQNFFEKEQKQELQNTLHYCLSSFQKVTELNDKHQKIHVKLNVFYREYEKAIKIGEYILKRFSFNINKTRESQTSTPPFWIDMSKLFELYVFGKLKKLFPEPAMVTYHDTFAGGKETDILVRDKEYKCVIDCKYKPRYENVSPSLDDARQLAGYTRLKSVYNRLEVDKTKIVRGVIIYPHQNRNLNFDKGDLFQNKIEEYIDFYKLGVKLPELNVVSIFSAI
jgi:5-methylcytosine-specific restriction enzyme subunit McrC